MKRYGDNLPSKYEDESENESKEMVQVIRGGCTVRYDMLDFVIDTEPPKQRNSLNIFSFLKFGQKKTPENS